MVVQSKHESLFEKIDNHSKHGRVLHVIFSSFFGNNSLN